MSAILGGPTSDQLIISRKLCNEDLERRNEHLEHMKQWLAAQPHLPDTWDERCLLAFLRGARFDPELCKKKLDAYFSVRATVPEFFTKRDIRRPELQLITQLVDGVPLPTLTRDAERITVVRAVHPDIETPELADMFKVAFMIGDIRIKDEQTGVGDVFILDAGLPLARHFVHVSLFTIRKFLMCVQDAYPVLIRQVHIVNASQFVDFIISVVRPFLNETLRNAIHVHTEIDTLYEFVEKDLLPQEYGGCSGTIDELKDNWLKELEKHTSWFEEEERFKADESKRSSWYKGWGYYFGFDN